MELEFDKEIDAILRRARGATAVTARGDHLDADVFAAFAEGALPQASKQFYTKHLADCDRCRKLLSQAITMNTAAVSAADEAASTVTSVVEQSSWLANLLRAPSLALAMGALVLTFSAALGYLVLRNQQTDTAMVSQSEIEMQKGGPSAGIEANESVANSNAPSNTTANAAASNVAVSSAVANSNGRVDNTPVSADGLAAAAPKPAAEAPPTDKSVAERDLEKLKSDGKEGKDDTTLLGGVRQETEDRRSSGNVSDAKKKNPGGPTRSAGPVQSLPQTNVQTYEMPVTRNAGGKKFTNRNGAWYDTAYRGQTTTNVRRGTDAYNKLDSGLRSIADSLGGTVVVVWKDKAYRIQ